MKVEKAKITDAEKLTSLTLKSKAYWNYAEEQIEKWRPELTITAAYIDKNEMYKLIIDDQLIAYYAYFRLDKGKVKLDNMFITPEFIGMGYGKLLMMDFMNRVKPSGYTKIMLDADPNAKGFYEKLGFSAVGRIKSSMSNRFLPVMEKNIS